MPIHYDATSGIFRLETERSAYAFQVTKWGYLAHLHWGEIIRPTAYERVLQFRIRSGVSPRPDPDFPGFSPDTLPQEYPSYGAGDFRSPVIQVELPNGSMVMDLKYRSHRVIAGKPPLEGLPSTYAEDGDGAETLEVELFDELTGMSAFLIYTVLPGYDAITRSVRLMNGGGMRLKLSRALSMSVDLPHSDFDFLQLSGAALRERFVYKRPLSPGGTVVESRRGVSGHQQNPFIALLAKDATEDYGGVYGVNLVYSGNFVASAEVDQFMTTRVSAGINPFEFGWQLSPGDSFQTPETVLVYSSEGLGGMSRIYHRLYRDRLCRGEYRHRERPILVNNWEATYFHFNTEKLVEIAKVGAELGIELLVLDDGWFGRRDDDRSSLGDWVVDTRKLPGGLDGLGRKIEALGLKFGLWLEPEMVSPDSDLYRSHPDWCLHVPDRRRTLGRNQLVLDLSRQDVRDYIVDAVSKVLASAPISYVKWDMNRNMTEIGSALLPPERQRETAHRYTLGLYEVLGRITSRFPDILFESCAGGGGRFNPAMLYYMPQTWTSDNSDAVSRLSIQYGTSLVYPPVTMGAHVSAVPNHQVGRITPLQTRGHAAMSGNLGYELDLTKLTEEEKAEVSKQVKLYKEIRPLIQFGSFYRLLSPFDGADAAWMFVSPDRREAVAFYFQVEADTAGPLRRLRLKGLDPALDYSVAGEASVYGGDHLMALGIPIPVMKGDYQSVMFRFSCH